VNGKKKHLIVRGILKSSLGKTGLKDKKSKQTDIKFKRKTTVYLSFEPKNGDKMGDCRSWCGSAGAHISRINGKALL
jgi:hypothetical protein